MKASCHSRNSLAAFSLQFMFTGQSFLLKGILRIWQVRPIIDKPILVNYLFDHTS